MAKRNDFFLKSIQAVEGFGFRVYFSLNNREVLVFFPMHKPFVPPKKHPFKGLNPKPPISPCPQGLTRISRNAIIVLFFVLLPLLLLFFCDGWLYLSHRWNTIPLSSLKNISGFLRFSRLCIRITGLLLRNLN